MAFCALSTSMAASKSLSLSLQKKESVQLASMRAYLSATSASIKTYNLSASTVIGAIKAMQLSSSTVAAEHVAVYVLTRGLNRSSHGFYSAKSALLSNVACSCCKARSYTSYLSVQSVLALINAVSATSTLPQSSAILSLTQVLLESWLTQMPFASIDAWIATLFAFSALRLFQLSPDLVGGSTVKSSSQASVIQRSAAYYAVYVSSINRAILKISASESFMFLCKAKSYALWLVLSAIGSSQMARAAFLVTI